MGKYNKGTRFLMIGLIASTILVAKPARAEASIWSWLSGFFSTATEYTGNFFYNCWATVRYGPSNLE